jgi:hypothetical protein
MSLDGKTLKVCSCNRTVALDAKALAAALKLKTPLQVHDQLCRRDAAAFQAALGDPDVIVACTQEASLFGELAAGAGSQANIQFVNVREAAGWSGERAKAMPKIAALVAMAALPEAEPAPAVGSVRRPGPHRGPCGRRPTGPSGSRNSRDVSFSSPTAAAANCRSSAARCGREDEPRRLARHFEGRMAAGKIRSISRSARAAMPGAGLPGAGDRLH